MQPYLFHPVFEPLKDSNLFKMAQATLGFASWNDEIDMTYDTLYLDGKITVPV